ncbi:MAG: phosphorylcholine transferase LicD [Lachnospira eligens]
MKFDNDFFNTEVREGFEISSMMKRAWAAQMEVFQVVSDICNRNGIRYFADFGTLLGAVRHKGMIPWDDDIDISLMRDEYNELIRILPGELPYGFVVAGMYADCERLQNAAFVPQLRVIADEELWNFNDYMKYFHGFPYQRAGIDIFPLDYISKDKEFADMQKQIIKLGMEILGKWNELNREGSLDKFVSEFGQLCNVNIELREDTKNYIWKLIDKVSSLCYRDEADYVSSMALWIDNDSYKMRKECFDDVIEMPFENFVVKAPKSYDEVLKAEFGDYMIPVKGTADHMYPFYGHMEQELIKQIRNVGFKGSVDEFCEEVASGRLRV